MPNGSINVDALTIRSQVRLKIVAEWHALIVISADLIMTVDSRLQGVSGYVYKNLSIVILSAVIKISLS